ncbi:MAG: diaminopimelate epimerase, partial [Candidatus Aminicenantes bacterium]|nr:diaminopimelate epimerase [Candidatus Aminicenantes bacterium]
MIFHKTSTSGNDFIIVDRVEFNRLGKDEGEFAKEICNKIEGPGADGVIFFLPENDIFNFSIFNSDGSEAEISGNGMAGLSATLFSMKKSRDMIKLQTRAGT